uniref:Uncharacterized protein n=1 Tax=Amphimedon queenslandica TaxID=400682 RepID=A0A1X7TYN0_AMPQE
MPCKLQQKDTDKFGQNNWLLPPKCIISISYSSPHTASHDRTESVLNYSVPIGGVVELVTLFIHREARALIFLIQILQQRLIFRKTIS